MATSNGSSLGIRQKARSVLRRLSGIRKNAAGIGSRGLVNDVAVMKRDFQTMWECIRELQAALNIQQRKPKDRGVGEGFTFDRTFDRLSAMRQLDFLPQTVADIGASDGSWTHSCLNIFPNAKYFCVEPLSENEPHLQHVVSQHPQVSYWIGGLGATPTTLVMNVQSNGSSFLNAPNGVPFGIQREIPVETLDNLIADGLCSSPEFIKIDVQGFELEVLKGATEALKTAQVVLLEASFIKFQESMPIFHEVIATMLNYGFVVYDIVSMLPRPYDNALAQCDIVFTRTDHFLRKSDRWN